MINSNKIEGSTLTEEQTIFLYETGSITTNPGIPVLAEDIKEMQNHFKLFKIMINEVDEHSKLNYSDISKEFISK